jgi:hypothetical protein
MRVQGETSTGSPAAIFADKKREAAICRPSNSFDDYAAVWAPFAAGWAVFLAFSFAANSYFTLAAMASVSTL